MSAYTVSLVDAARALGTDVPTVRDAADTHGAPIIDDHEWPGALALSDYCKLVDHYGPGGLNQRGTVTL